MFNDWLSNHHKISIIIATQILVILLLVWDIQSQTMFSALQGNSSPPLPYKLKSTVDMDLGNASIIFNMIHDLFDVKGSSIHPNGMSIVLASLPKGTTLYHTSCDTTDLASPEYYAFNYEVSYNFRPIKGTGMKNRDVDFGTGTTFNSVTPLCFGDRRLISLKLTRDLNRLLLLDGNSAAKTTAGNMDSQLLLAGRNLSDIVNEDILAREICETYDIDGIIRMEADFEIILCNLQEYHIYSNVSLQYISETSGLSVSDTATLLKLKNYQHLEVATKDHAFIPLEIDILSLVTPINRQPFNIDPYKRRLLDSSPNLVRSMRQEVHKALKMPRKNTKTSTNSWKALISRCMDKYTPFLLSLQNYTAAETNIAVFANRAYLLLGNHVIRYLDSSVADLDIRYKQAIENAVDDMTIPTFPIHSDTEVLIHRALQVVVEHIVTLLFDAHHDLAMHKKTKNLASFDLAPLHGRLSEAIAMLDWASFYRCQKCSAGHVCMTPNWGPFPSYGTLRNSFYTDKEKIRRISRDLSCVSFEDAW
ncbi:BA75_04401T0 [Komagataella pastoris]|uniref:BA75_04401T0 n=1 Tax=Komagataella pastoris TaxID=4922 RepID=A0A1B2JI82_PICPA|nr:BA75_04401T0 [Komagataella pastoris]